MMIVMKEEATPEQIDSVVKRVESVGAHAHVSEGEVLTVIGAIGDRERIANLDLDGRRRRRPRRPDHQAVQAGLEPVQARRAEPWSRSTGARSAAATSP